MKPTWENIDNAVSSIIDAICIEAMKFNATACIYSPNHARAERSIYQSWQVGSLTLHWKLSLNSLEFAMVPKIRAHLGA
jgi:hypothetical protein